MPNRSQSKAEFVFTATDKASPKINKIAGATKKAAGATGGYEKVLKKTGLTTAQLTKQNESYILTSNRMRGATSGLRQAIGRLRNTLLLVAFATAGLVAAIRENIRAANKMESALLGLSSVARNTGQALQLTEDAAIALTENGLLTVKEASEGLRNLLSAGFGLKESKDLMDALTNSAAFNRQGTLAMGQAIVGATQGIKNQNSIMVDNAGITKNLSILYKEYAATINSTAGSLTEVQKRTAIYTGILREAKVFSGDAIKVTKTLNGQIARLGVETFETSAAIGELLQPAIAEIIGSMANASKSVRNWIAANEEFIKTDVIGTVKQLIGALKIILTSFASVVPVILRWLPAILQVGTAFLIFKTSVKILARMEMAFTAGRTAMIAYETAVTAGTVAQQRSALASTVAAVNAGGLSGAMARLTLAAGTTDFALIKQIRSTRVLSAAQVQAAITSQRFATAQFGLAHGLTVASSAMGKFRIAMMAMFTGPGAIAIAATVAIGGLIWALSEYMRAADKAAEKTEKLRNESIKTAEAQRKATARVVEGATAVLLLAEQAAKLKGEVDANNSSAFVQSQKIRELSTIYQSLLETLKPIRDEFGDIVISMDNLSGIQEEAGITAARYNEALVKTRILEARLEINRLKSVTTLNLMTDRLNLLGRTGIGSGGLIEAVFHRVAEVGDDFSTTTLEGRKNLVAFADALKEAAAESAAMAEIDPAYRKQSEDLLKLVEHSRQWSEGLRGQIEQQEKILAMQNPFAKSAAGLLKVNEELQRLGAGGKTTAIELEFAFFSPGGTEMIGSPVKMIGSLEKVRAKLKELSEDGRRFSQDLRVTLIPADVDKLLQQLSTGLEAAGKKSTLEQVTGNFARTGSTTAIKAQTASLTKELTAQLFLIQDNEETVTAIREKFGITREQLLNEIIASYREKKDANELVNLKAQQQRLFDTQFTLEQKKQKILQDGELANMKVHQEHILNEQIGFQRRKQEVAEQADLAGLRRLNQLKLEDELGFERRRILLLNSLRRKNVDDLAQGRAGSSRAVTASIAKTSGQQGQADLSAQNEQLETERTKRIENAAGARVRIFRHSFNEVNALVEEEVASAIMANETILANFEEKTNTEATLILQSHQLFLEKTQGKVLAENAASAARVKIITDTEATIISRQRNFAIEYFRIVDKEQTAFIAFTEQRIAEKLRETDERLKNEQLYQHEVAITRKGEFDLEVEYARRSIELETWKSEELFNLRRGLANASENFGLDIARNIEESTTTILNRLVGNTEGTTIKIKQLQAGLSEFEAKLIQVRVEDQQKAFKKELTLRKAVTAVAISAAAAATSAVLRGLQKEYEMKAVAEGGEALKSFAKGPTGFAQGLIHLKAAAKFGIVAGTAGGAAAAVSSAGSAQVEAFNEKADQVEQGGLDGTTTSPGSRKIGGTIEARNLSLTIAPSVTIEATGDVFLSDGSIQELEANIGNMAVNSIQNAIDTNEIDLSTAVGLAD